MGRFIPPAPLVHGVGHHSPEKEVKVVVKLVVHSLLFVGRHLGVVHISNLMQPMRPKRARNLALLCEQRMKAVGDEVDRVDDEVHAPAGGLEDGLLRVRREQTRVRVNDLVGVVD